MASGLRRAANFARAFRSPAGLARDGGMRTPQPPDANSSTARVRGVEISRPDKALWPDAGDSAPVTKIELANYYAAVGEWMLPHIAGRPCSILRAPDGIDGQIFFQRHATQGTSDL